MSIKNLEIPNKKVLYCGSITGDDATFTNINGLPVGDIVTDTTDVSLTAGNVMVGDGTLKIKQSGVNIDTFNDVTGVDVLNCNTVDATFGVSASDGIFDLTTSGRLLLSGGTNRIDMKDSLDTFASTISAPTLTGNRIITIPDLTGTLAVTGASQNVSFNTVTGNTGSIANLSNVSKIYGQNGAYFEFDGVGLPPLVRAIGSSPWQLGASESSNLNRQISIGYYNAIDRGLIYAYDQGALLGKNMQYGFPAIPVAHYFEGSINSSTNSLNGITIPASGGTLAKLSDIPVTTPAYIHVCWENFLSNLYTVGQVIPLSSGIVANSLNMSLSTDAIFLPSGVNNKYRVSVSIPVYRDSQLQLYDGNNNAISYTRITGGNPTIDAVNHRISATFIISQPALDKFTLRSAGNSWVGNASSGLVSNVPLHVTVERIA